MSRTLLPEAEAPSLAIVREIVYDQSAIRKRVSELGRQIDSDYRGKDLTVVGILKGAFAFTSDLIRSISVSVDLDFLAVSRYHPRRDEGRVRLLKDLQHEVSGKHLLLVGREPASITICTLLDRRDLRLVEVPIGYVGFRASEPFLIGYGLDYQDRYRNLPYIASMDLDAVRLRKEVEPEAALAYQAG